MGLCCIITRDLRSFCMVMCLQWRYVCNFSNLRHTDRHSLSMFVYWVSMSVSVLLVKAMGCLFWIRAVPKPYSLALVYTVTCCFLSQ